ncbi:hypothetical protein [Devosia sp. 2618]|uniref:hypothetical protein n=1 Tax=Devosia sp. 2618 TaxID=3156454 RepID=UPI003394D2FC
MIGRVFCAVVLIAAAASSIQAEPFHHPFGEWREYNRDWLAVCPDEIDEDAVDYYGISCFASTGSNEKNAAGLPAYKLTVFRNRLNGDLDIAITVAADDVAIDQTRPIELAMTGETPANFDFINDLETRYDTANQFFIRDPLREEALLEAMRDSEAVTLSVPLIDVVPAKDVALSLRGVAASIDFMATYARRVAQY